MSGGENIVILSSLSHPRNNASSIDDEEAWVRCHKDRILRLRHFLLTKFPNRNDNIKWDIEISSTNIYWHINFIGPQTTVLIILSLGLLDFYLDQDRSCISDEDRHTSIVEKIIKGLDNNPNYTKKFFFVIFERQLMDSIPIIWTGCVWVVQSDKDYPKLISVIKNKPLDFEPPKPIKHRMVYCNDEANYINYWKLIYNVDKTYVLLNQYFIERNLLHKPISDYESSDNAANRSDNIDKSLMTSDLYTTLTSEWRSKMILIHGPSGSGKTALGQMLCHRWAKGESLTMFRAIILINVNKENFLKPMIELIRFVPSESTEKKKAIFNGLSLTPDRVLFVFDIEDYPWRNCEQFYSSEIGQILQHHRSESILVLTNQLCYSCDDKKLMSDSDIIYELQCFNQDQLKQFFRKRHCPIDMKCSEIFQELCKLPIYAVMIPRSDHITEHKNLTSFCKDIVIQIIIRNVSKEGKTLVIHSLEDYLIQNRTFAKICELAWDLVIDQTNLIPITNVKASHFKTQQNGLGFLDFITKPDKELICTTYLIFRLSTIQYFLAAFHFVFNLCTPEIGREFLVDKRSGHLIHNVWRFVTGLLNDSQTINGLLVALGNNHSPSKLLYIQAISESGMNFSEMDAELKKIISTWINSFKWEKIHLYPSDCLAIMKTFNFLNEEDKSIILERIEELNFAQTYLDNEGFFHLIECLSKLKRVKLINMGGNPNFLNPLSRHGCVGYLKEILKNNCCTLKHLYLSSSGLTSAGLRILKPTFLQFTRLVQLDLSRNRNIGSNGWKLFSNFLGELKVKKLSKLLLSDNNIDFQNTVNILTELTNYQTLELLNLSGNDMNKETVKKLINVLMNNNLRRLFLSNCRLTNDVLSILLEFMSSNERYVKNVVSLGLSWNEFDDEIMERLISSLKSTTNLQTLMLNHNRIGKDSSMQILSESLRNMPRLGGLYLSQCNIEDNGALILCSSSQNLTVDLRKNRIKNPQQFKLYAHTAVV